MVIKVLLAVLLFPVLANAGAISGGGGKSVVCRDQNKQIVSAQLLDLYEGDNLYLLKAKTFGATIDENIAGVETKLQSTMVQPDFYIFPLITQVQKIMHLVPQGTKLVPIDDAALMAVPANCAVEQLANYVDDTLLLVDSEIWNALDVRNKSALIMHEAIYLFERLNSKATDSRRSRKIVAHLFSDFEFENVMTGMPADAVQCTVGGDYEASVFYMYKKGHMTVLQFTWMNGEAVFSKSTGVIPYTWPWAYTHLGNISAGSTTSKFEGNKYIFVSVEQSPLSSTPDSQYFIEIDGKKQPMSCASLDGTTNENASQK